MAKKTSTKKTAAVKKRTEKTSCTSCCSKKKEQQSTVITARFNAGWGNSLYIRGEGGELSWDCGIPMECQASDCWVWYSDRPVDKFVFKFALNDETWSKEENLTVSGGTTTTYYPSF